MNKEAIIVGESYECRKTDFARPIIGEVIRLRLMLLYKCSIKH